MLNVFILLIFMATLSSVVLILYSVIRHTSERSFFLIFLSIATFMFTFGYLLEITAPTIEAAFYGVKVQKAGVSYIVPLAYLFTRDLYGEKRFNPLKICLIFLIPVITMVAFYAFPTVKLYYTSIEYIANEYIANCKGHPGPLYHLGNIYNYLYFFLSIQLILRKLKNENQQQRVKSYFSLIAFLIPLLSAVTFYIWNSSIPFDTNPFALAISLIILLLNIQSQNPLNIIPLARVQVIEKMDDAFVICDDNFNFLDANMAAKGLFPELNTITIGESLKNIPNFKTEGELNIQVGDMVKIYKAVQSHIFDDTKNSGLCILFHDFTEEKKLLEKLRIQATVDPLMDIYNRGAFFDLVTSILSINTKGISYSLLIIDIDFFKKVNDTYGHTCGDEVLKIIASIVKDNFHKDSVIGRYGGEEIVVLLEDIPLNQVLEKAEKLRSNIEKTKISYGEYILKLTVSIGVAHAFHKNEYSIETLFSEADIALYNAKNGGRNRICLYDDISDKM